MLYDRDIREDLFMYLEEVYGKTRIIEEKRMGCSRADVIMVTDGALYGLEIKSDADTYQRLKTQTADYDRYFDHNFIVCGSSHAGHVAEHVPDHWGIITVDELEDKHKPDFYMLRKPGDNEFLDMKLKLSLLWRPELQNIMAYHEFPKYAGKSKKFVIEYIADHVDREQLDRQITNELFERDYTTIADTINRYRVEVRKVKPRRKKRIGKATKTTKATNATKSTSLNIRKKAPSLHVAHVIRSKKKK